MKYLSFAMLVLLIGCAPAAPSNEAKAVDVYGRYVCTIPAERTSSPEFKTPWVLKDDLFLDKCSNGLAICWWAKTPTQFDPETRHKHFYVPIQGSTCHYETAGGKKPNSLGLKFNS